MSGAPHENRFSIRSFSDFDAASLQGYLQDEDALREVFDSDFCAACRSAADMLPEEVEDFDRCYHNFAFHNERRTILMNRKT